MKIYKAFLMVLVVCLSVAVVTVAAADDTPKAEITGRDAAFECQFNLAVGGAPWMAGYENLFGSSTTAVITGRVGVRLRMPKYTPLVLDVSVVFPHGIGATIGVDVVHTDRVRLHIGDAGLFVNATVPVSVARLERNIDLVVGLGLEVKLTKTVSVTLDWRVFLPPPISTMRSYGDFARPLFDEAFKGGQVWIGFSRVW